MATPASAQAHTADQDDSFSISLSELLRVIQFFNVGALQCQEDTEDGYAPGPGDESCTPHDSDYMPTDFTVSLSELLRLIQFFNVGGYMVMGGTEDGFAPNEVIVDPEGEGTTEGEGEGLPPRDPRIELPRVEVPAGEVASLAVSFVPEAGTVDELSFTISFNNNALSFISAQQGSSLLVTGKALSVTAPQPGSLDVAITDQSGMSTPLANATLFTLNFQVDAGLDVGTAVQLFLSDIVATQPDGDPAVVQSTVGRVLVSSGGSDVPPSAHFTASPTTLLPDNAVAFNNTSLLGTGSDATFAWDFGDGGTSTEEDPTYTYTTPGTYTVELTVTTTVGADTQTEIDFVTVVNPAIVFVDADNDSGTEDGTSWATAFTTVQPAIDAAADAGGGEVWIAAGTYDEVRDNDDGALVLMPLVEAYGGFAGNESGREQRDVSENESIIDGSTARDGDPAYHVVVGASQTRLDGVTVTGGLADGTGQNALGGGMLNTGNTMTIANCIFRGNTAVNFGGGMANSGADITIENCTFESNFATNLAQDGSTALGGGLYINFGRATIRGTVFTGNVARSETTFTGAQTVNSEASGGGLYVFNGTVEVLGSRFAGNRVESFGTGVNNEGPQTVVQPRARGGGIFTRFADIRVDGALVLENEAEAEPNATFSEACGAGIFNEDSFVEIVNTVVAKNVTRDQTNTAGGAGLCNDYNGMGAFTLLISNCTIADNDTDSFNFARVGGLLLRNVSPTVVNTIIWGNDGLGIGGDNTFPTVQFSNTQGGSLPGMGNQSVTPAFRNPGENDYALLNNSLLIDAGTDTSGPALGRVTTDLTGTPRPFDTGVPNRGDGSDYDIGAFEVVF